MGAATIWPNTVAMRIEHLRPEPEPRRETIAERIEREPLPPVLWPTMELWDRVDRLARAAEKRRRSRPSLRETLRRNRERANELIFGIATREVVIPPEGTWTPIWLFEDIDLQEADDSMAEEDLLPWERQEILLSEYRPAEIRGRKWKPRGRF